MLLHSKQKNHRECQPRKILLSSFTDYLCKFQRMPHEPDRSIRSEHSVHLCGKLNCHWVHSHDKRSIYARFITKKLVSSLLSDTGKPDRNRLQSWKLWITLLLLHSIAWIRLAPQVNLDSSIEAWISGYYSGSIKYKDFEALNIKRF